MSKFCGDLLDAEEPTFTTSIRQLEEVSGQNWCWILKLIGDITAMAHRKLASLV